MVSRRQAKGFPELYLFLLFEQLFELFGGPGVMRIDLQGLAKINDGLAGLSLRLKRKTQIVINLSNVRVKLDGLAEILNRLIEFAA